MTKLTYEESAAVKKTLKEVYSALEEKGYDPIMQLTGYILSGDPSYITGHKNAKSLIRKVERDDIMIDLLTTYLGK